MMKSGCPLSLRKWRMADDITAEHEYRRRATSRTRAARVGGFWPILGGTDAANFTSQEVFPYRSYR